MRVIIPMSGHGERFKRAGYIPLKPLIPVEGRPMIETIVAQFPRDWNFTFVCNEEHLARTELRKVLEAAAPGATIVAIPSHKKGPVWAVLEAIRLAPASVPDDEPCLVNYCDFGFSWSAPEFTRFARETGCDGAVFCYTGFHPEYLRPTLYAYCREEKGRLAEIKEKGHFTPDRTREPASSGSYFFKRGALIRKYFQALMAEGPLLNGEGYVSLVYNFLVRDGLDVRVFPIPYFLQWGTPEDLRDYEYWAGVYARYAPRGRPPAPARPGELQLLMPMAGRGSRFEGEVPKPLIEVLGQPMFQAAAAHLPAARRKVFVVRDSFAPAVRAREPDARLLSISQVTEGQAITCELAAAELDPNLPLLVSSCDHGMVFDRKKWDAILADDPDVVVWGQRHYPGAGRSPKAFAYIQADPGTNRITKVSVKEPLGPDPEKDLLLVGTFYFRRPALMLEAIAELKRRDLRVNGEFYLDSVVNLCVEKGLDTRVFSADGYLCWGTPEALREFTYWDGYFKSRALAKEAGP